MRGSIVIRLAAQMAGKQLLGSVGLTSIMSWRALPGGTHVCDPPRPRGSRGIARCVQITQRLIARPAAGIERGNLLGVQRPNPITRPMTGDGIGQHERNADKFTIARHVVAMIDSFLAFAHFTIS
jgi:hypothetical protein